MSRSRYLVTVLIMSWLVLGACGVGIVDSSPDETPDGLRIGNSTIWYSPMQFTGAAGSIEAGLRAEYMRLFDEPDAWRELRSHTSVFPLYILQLQDDAGPNRDRTITSDGDLRRMASAINGWGLKVAIQLRGFRGQSGSRPDGCDAMTGENMAARELRYIDRWLAAGGRVDIVMYDSPIGNALLGGGSVGPPPECKPPIDYNFLIQEVADHARAVANRFPSARLTWTESPVFFPFERFGTQLPTAAPLPDLRSVLDGMNAAFATRGLRLDAYLADWNYGYAPVNDGWRKLAAVRSYVEGMGVRFGMFCTSDLDGGRRTGLGVVEDDARHKREVVACWGQAAANGIDVSDRVLQNWHEWPARTLPESENATSANVASAVVRQLGDAGIIGLACGGATPSQRGQCHPTSIGQRCAVAMTSATGYAWSNDPTCLSGVQCGGANPSQRGQCSASSAGQRCSADQSSPTGYALHNDPSCGGEPTWQLFQDCRPGLCPARDCTTPAIGPDVAASGIRCSVVGQICNTPSGARSFTCR